MTGEGHAKPKPMRIENEETNKKYTPRQDQNSVVAVYGQHSAAEDAIKPLEGGGFDIKKPAVVGRDYQTEEDVVGFYNTGDRMKYWGKWGAFWGGVWGMLVGAAFLIVPGIGPVVAAGSVVDWIIAALEGAIVVGGVSALGAGLSTTTSAGTCAIWTRAHRITRRSARIGNVPAGNWRKPIR